MLTRAGMTRPVPGGIDNNDLARSNMSEKTSAIEVPACPTNVARYQAYRGQIEHEDHLLGIRVGWLIAAEAFLIAAYANLANADHLCNAAHDLFALLPFIGGFIAFFVGLAILAAILALRQLRRKAGEFAVAGFPDGAGSRARHWLGLAPTTLIPIALVGLWLSVGFFVKSSPAGSGKSSTCQSASSRYEQIRTVELGPAASTDGRRHPRDVRGTRRARTA